MLHGNDGKALEEAMSAPALHKVPIHDEQEEAGGSLIDHLLDLLELCSRHVALLAAWIALCGSLFLSEVIGWPPCMLCWYQRILMYPLALILAIGIWRRDQGLHLYVLPFSILGAATSLYHYLLIKTAWFPPPACSAGIPCTVDYLNWFGFINIPFLALMAFLIITCMMAAWALLRRSTTPTARLDGTRLAVLMIPVAVVLSFMVAATFV